MPFAEDLLPLILVRPRVMSCNETGKNLKRGGHGAVCIEDREVWRQLYLLRVAARRDDHLALLGVRDPMRVLSLVGIVDDFSDELGRDFTRRDRLDRMASSFGQRRLCEPAG